MAQNNYTKQAKEVLRKMRTIARQLDHPYVGTEHLLLALRKVFTGVAGQVLAANQVHEEEIYQIMEELVTPLVDVQLKEKAEYSPRLEFILEESAEEAVRLRSSQIGTEHLLIAMLRDVDCVATRILITMDVNLQKLFRDILETSGADIQNYQEELIQEGRRSSGSSGQTLEQYSTDLTSKAESGTLDPVIGREKEIERVMQILGRRTKNNPCLVGEPGVGKTAIIEGLANRIAEGTVPDAMKDKRIVTLDLSGMVAGSKYRGEFEERMKKMIQDVKAAGNIILFLDEVHTIIGAGGAEGSIDASNILKPSLARGELQLVGATTINEYRKYIEKDAALERRFQPVAVEEPSEEQCLKILEGLKSRYEEHHGVTIQEEALETATHLSKQYINDRFLPDKAIDVLDETCSKIGLHISKNPVHLAEMNAKIKMLDEEIERALVENDIVTAREKRKEVILLEKKYEQAQKRKKRTHTRNSVVTAEDIADVVAAWTGVPVQNLTQSESVRLQKLEQTLHKRVIGQTEAVTAVAKAVRRGRVGLKDPKRPIGSFLFLGPTGVGKTELSKTLAQALFGKEDAMIRIDMSEYMEKHSVAKLIGAPPGYIGHDDGGQLSEQVRRHPYSVILFDEIEKAHPDVFNVLLQVLDDGRITDSQGRVADFKNTVIIMTSNAGARAIVDPKKLGFATVDDAKSDYKRMKSSVMEEIKQVFRPEFLNRIDEIIVFHTLGKEELKKITGLLCKELTARLKKEMDISFSMRDSAKMFIVEKGSDTKFGARPLKRTIQNEIEDKLADAILDGTIHAGMKVEAGIYKKAIKFYYSEDK